MPTFVPFITAEDGDDLIVSFGLGQYAQTSLTLLRTPKYEHLLEAKDRGVSVATADSKGHHRESLESVEWNNKTLKITSSHDVYELDICAVETEEILEAKRILKKMNFDKKFVFMIEEA